VTRKCRENPPSGPFSRLEIVARPRAFLTVLALSAVAALTLSACGEEGAELLPGNTASAINSNLDSVEQLVAEGDCTGASDAAAEVSTQVEELNGVDRELKEALGRGAARLNEVVQQCQEEPEEPEETAPVEEEEPSEEEGEEREDRERAAEKAQQKAEKAEEKAQRDEEREEKETPPSEPPGQEKGGEKAPETPSEDGGTPSGGVAPSTPAEGGE
jgi:outer membrane biosynthesis protein TonB